MSLSSAKPILVKDILAIFENEAEQTESPEQSRERIAEQLANAIDKFVKAGKIEIETGIKVSTTGTATSQTGVTTSKGTGKII